MYMMPSDEEDSSEAETEDDSEADVEVEGEVVDSEVVEEGEETEQAADAPAAEEVKELSPYEKAVQELENKMKAEVSSLEAMLKNERNNLLKTKDKVSESGKNGFFIVQAQVAEFQKKRDADQKSRVVRNKHDFVQKMLPVVDAFRAAREVAPPTNEREEKMHNNFGSLLSSILNVFEKYGYEEFDAEVGTKLIPAKHQVSEVVDGAEDGLVVSQIKRGIATKEGEVLRRALVVASKAPGSEAAPAAGESEQSVDEESADEPPAPEE
jgi:molecular chaperone GrpE (heat shock protein)